MNSVQMEQQTENVSVWCCFNLGLSTVTNDD